MIWISYLWTGGMVLGARLFKGTLENSGVEFSQDLVLGAIGWLGVVAHTTPISISVGISMLIAPFWATILLHDLRATVAGFTVLVGCGLTTSWVVYGTYWCLGANIGGLLAPVLVALYLFGFLISQAKDALQSLQGKQRLEL
jgi:hypothetical protein